MNTPVRPAPVRSDDVPALLGGLHSDPTLRTWVSVGSVALPPVPEPDEHGWTLWALLAHPIRANGARLTYRPAWGAVQWRWARRRVRQHIRLPAGLAPTGAVGLWTTHPGGEVSALRRALFDRLAEVLATAPPADAGTLAALADGYRGLLPGPAYAAYHALAPRSGAWLHPADPD